MALPENSVMVPRTYAPYIDVTYEVLPFSKEISRGGVALNNPSQGLNTQDWTVNWNPESGNFVVTSESGIIQTIPTIALDISSFSFCFDSNMQPALVYQNSAGTFLYFFDSALPGFSLLSLDPMARSVKLYHDDKRKLQVNAGVTDALLFYLIDDKLFMRRQRDRYATEIQLATLASRTCSIRRVGMTSDYRIQFELTGENLFVSSP